MSNSTTVPAPKLDQPASRIGQTALIITVWTLTALATCFIIARNFIRIRWSRRLFADDYFAVLALLVLIGNSIVTTLMAPPMYELLDVSTGRAPATPAFLKRASFYLKCQFAETVLFWSCLWAVKGCFLAFFLRLTNQLKWPRRAWYIIVVITVLAYIGCIITYPVSCTSFVLGDCQAPINISRSLISLRYSTAVDVITDLFIILLPLFLTFRLQMSLPQKLGLIMVFSLGVIVTIFSIIRIIVTNTDGSHPEISWLALWSSIECSVAVIVACLASFKVFFVHRNASSYAANTSRRQQDNASGRHTRRRDGSGTHNREARGTRIGLWRLNSSSDHTENENLGGPTEYGVTVVGGKGAQARSQSRNPDWEDDSASQKRILGENAITVQTEWHVNHH